ncbi:hypothetical protein H0A58_10300 [Alcaligenaceae bacterium]|nr:hypothetical protein [Alcaligenaceae bacterium]
MKKTLSAQDRALHIELVRARAAMERQRLKRSVGELSHSLRPASLAKGVLPGLAGGDSVAGWLLRIFSLSRRYPLLTSGASALLSGVGKRHRLIKISLGLLVAWQVMRAGQKLDN